LQFTWQGRRFVPKILAADTQAKNTAVVLLKGLKLAVADLLQLGLQLCDTQMTASKRHSTSEPC
jgi:hypothetical protein